MKLPCLVLMLFASALAHGTTTPQFQQNLGHALPLHAAFVDADGRHRELNAYFGKTPVIMVFGYYHCPRLCSTLMDGVLQSAEAAGLPYTIVGIGIDPRETPRDAAAKLGAYRQITSRTTALHLLTGQPTAIAAVADAAGFHYAYDAASDQYSHPAGFLIATPEGRISRYFMGIGVDRRDLRLALIEASNRRIGGLTEQVLLLCSHYDPLTGRYTVAVMTLARAAGMMTLLLLVMGVWLARKRHAARRHETAARPR